MEGKQMRCLSKVTAAAAVLVSVLVFSMTAALAAASNNAVDWNSSVIRATGGGAAPYHARSQSQARLMARRAAIVDAYRQLAEYAGGVNIDAETTVDMAAVTSDVIKSRVSATIRGAKIVAEGVTSDGGYEVTMEVPLFGVSSLASAVMERPPVIEPFPMPNGAVNASQPSPAQAGSGINAGSADKVTGSAASAAGSSAAAAPSGQAIGGFTGLIVDCRGLGLKPVMSPIVKSANGQPIYGYKNLDYDKIIANGMAGYAKDRSQAGRAGSNPLVVKAVALDNHNSTPVLSPADANLVLIENGATHFLDATNVVFLRG